MIVQIIQNIVESIRSTGTITNISESSGVSTITSKNSLVAGESVQIGSTDYIVQSATSTEFTVLGTGITENSWTALAPYFDVGHPLEVSNRLLEKDKSDEYKYRKYPLIVLFTDIKIKKGERASFDDVTDLNISIIGQSERTKTTLERYSDVINPILYPIYNKLKSKIKASPYFTKTHPSLTHDLTERPYWGSSSKYGNVKNIFNDPLDAIEMNNIELGLRLNNC